MISIERKCPSFRSRIRVESGGWNRSRDAGRRKRVETTEGVNRT